MRQVMREAKQGRTGPAEGEATRPLRILVLDDDQVDRMAVRRALGRTGLALTISEAEAVLPAIDLLATEPFDCVFLDYNLPDGDGLTFLLGVRAAGIGVPVVMLTGQQDESIAARLTESGAADYIAKGELTPARLAESLRRALS
jgi:CheY-like chemotaxis protein